MYKPPQAKRSSWSPVSTQRQGKVQTQPGWLPVPPKQQEGGSEASELPSYSSAAFDLLAAKTIRSIEARERRQQLGEAGKQAKSMSLAARSIQAKLTVGEAGDAYEQEADRVAARVMSMPSPVREQQSTIQGNDAIASKQEYGSALRRLPKPQASPKAEPQASGELENRLNASQGGGSPLAPEVKAFMEPRFVADFSQVRVHTGSEAVQMNRELGAQAFARGQDIYFGAGKSPGNNELMAHELTHVVQQTGGVQRLTSDYTSKSSEKKEKPSIRAKFTLARPDDRYKQEPYRGINNGRNRLDVSVKSRKRLSNNSLSNNSERLIYELRNQISVAATSDISAGLIAAILYNENQLRNAWDSIQDTEARLIVQYEGWEENLEVGLWEATTRKPIRQQTFGQAQMQPQVVEELVEGGYINKPQGWDGDELDRSLELLLNKTKSPSLVAGRLQQTVDHWRNGGVDISRRPEILGTLYHIGLTGKSGVNSNPQPNQRGTEIARTIPRMRQILAMP